MTPWFRVPISKPNAEKRFFVFHHAGSSANAYFRWASLVPATTELVLCELPGRGGRQKENLISDFSEMVEPLVESLSRELSKPSILFGHSLGALIAFEAARRVNSTQVVGLALSSFLPPTEANVKARERIAHLPDETFIQKIERFSPIPDVVRNDKKALDFFLPIIRSDIQLIETYKGGSESVSIPAIIFCGSADTLNPSGRLAEWKSLVSVQGQVQILDGDHFFVFAHAQTILDRLHDKLL